MVDDPNTPQDVDDSTTAAQTVVDAAQEVAQTPSTTGSGLDMLLGVGLRISVELGRTRMKISEILSLGPGSVIELQKLASEPVDIMVNDTPFARGEVVVVDDHFGVKITELLEGAAHFTGE